MRLILNGVWIVLQWAAGDRLLPCDVAGITDKERACAVAAAAAHDWNDELTVILNSITSSIETLEPGHPARALLLQTQSAAQRCAWTASGLLNYTAKQGAKPAAAAMEALIGLLR